MYMIYVYKIICIRHLQSMYCLYWTTIHYCRLRSGGFYSNTPTYPTWQHREFLSLNSKGYMETKRNFQVLNSAAFFNYSKASGWQQRVGATLTINIHEAFQAATEKYQTVSQTTQISPSDYEECVNYRFQPFWPPNMVAPLQLITTPWHVKNNWNQWQSARELHLRKGPLKSNQMQSEPRDSKIRGHPSIDIYLWSENIFQVLPFSCSGLCLETYIYIWITL